MSWRELRLWRSTPPGRARADAAVEAHAVISSGSTGRGMTPSGTARVVMSWVPSCAAATARCYTGWTSRPPAAPEAIARARRAGIPRAGCRSSSCSLCRCPIGATRDEKRRASRRCARCKVATSSTGTTLHDFSNATAGEGAYMARRLGVTKGERCRGSQDDKRTNPRRRGLRAAPSPSRCSRPSRVFSRPSAVRRGGGSSGWPRPRQLPATAGVLVVTARGTVYPFGDAKFYGDFLSPIHRTSP